REQKAPYGRPERQQDEATREGGKDDQQIKAHRRGEGLAGLRVQVGAHRADADEPRLGVDPLKGSCSPEPERRFIRCRVTATRRGNLPRQPEQEGYATPLENQEQRWARQDNVPKSQGHEEYH